MSWVPMDDGLPKLLWERKTYKKLKEIIYNFLFFIIAVKDPTLKFVRAPMVPTIWLPWLPCIRKIPAIIWVSFYFMVHDIHDIHGNPWYPRHRCQPAACHKPNAHTPSSPHGPTSRPDLCLNPIFEWPKDRCVVQWKFPLFGWFPLIYPYNRG